MCGENRLIENVEELGDYAEIKGFETETYRAVQWVNLDIGVNH